MGRHVAAVLGFVLATVAYTWPLARHVGSVVPRDLADPLLSIWTLWWNATVPPFTTAWWNGPIFAPATGVLAFSDHRVGLGLLTTPAIWSGVSPVAAYDLAFLATFVLGGIATYALGLVLTGHRVAAFLGGLIFAFHPVRAAHLEHLELLATYWLPVVFLCLHRWHAARVWWALPGLSVSLAMLALTSGYLFVFGGVLVGAWLVWFARNEPRRDLLRLAAAIALPLVVVAPVFIAVRGVHATYGFERTIVEIEQLSADLADFVAAPELLLLGRLLPAATSPERALFPGIAAVALVLWAAARAPAEVRASSRVSWARRLCVVVAAGGGAVASASALGVDAIAIASWRLPIRAAYKPVTIAVAAVAVWLLTSARVRAAWATRAPGAFYALATVGLWIFALGPTARVLGERVLYKAPYAWLMVLPGFGSGLRAPARFAVVASLTLAVAATIVLARWRPRPGWRAVAVWSALGVAIVGDGWIAPLPLHPVPAPLEVPSTVSASSAIVELPLGLYDDAAAMFRAIGHGRPILNGLSGFEPPAYSALERAMQGGDVFALAAAVGDRGAVAFIPHADATKPLLDALGSMTSAEPLPSTATHALVRLPAWVEPEADVSAYRVVRVSAVTASNGSDASHVLDDDLRTIWWSGPQRGGEALLLDLGGAASVAAVRLAQGSAAFGYPERLTIDLSVDGVTWDTAWRGPTAARAVAAARVAPRESVLTFRFAGRAARFVRLTQEGTSPMPWTVASLAVLAGPS